MALLAERSTPHMLRVMGSSEFSEWYTPQHIVERDDPRARRDRCRSVLAPRLRRCRRGRPTQIDEDGLAQPWAGRVYMNPPYGREIGDWIAKLVAEHEAGAVTEAIALVPARVDTAWFRRLDQYPCCFVYGRLQYSNAVISAPFPNAIFYLGRDVRRFAEAFCDIGGIGVRLEAARMSDLAKHTGRSPGNCWASPTASSRPRRSCDLARTARWRSRSGAATPGLGTTTRPKPAAACST